MDGPLPVLPLGLPAGVVTIFDIENKQYRQTKLDLGSGVFRISKNWGKIFAGH